MRLTLDTIDVGYATLGLLRGPGRFLLHTVEQPWNDNERFASCVPGGYYTLEPHSSESHGQTWALVGESVWHYDERDAVRFGCLLHAANYASQLKGCIAPGAAFYDFDGVIGVRDSRPSMELLRAKLERGGTHSLTIRRR